MPSNFLPIFSVIGAGGEQLWPRACSAKRAFRVANASHTTSSLQFHPNPQPNPKSFSPPHIQKKREEGREKKEEEKRGERRGESILMCAANRACGVESQKKLSSASG